MSETWQSTRTTVDLNGDWERHVHGKLVDIVAVPSSLRPSGLYRLRRTFLLPRLAKNERAILHFDAINYHGRVFLNGHELGTTILLCRMSLMALAAGDGTSKHFRNTNCGCFVRTGRNGER
jgi:hypothetical protein